MSVDVVIVGADISGKLRVLICDGAAERGYERFLLAPTEAHHA